MITSGTAGAALGVGVMLYSNAVRKLPLMRAPWMHVLAGTVGASAITGLVEYEARATKQLEAKLRERADAHAKFEGVLQRGL